MKKLKQLFFILAICLSFQGFSQDTVKYEYLSICQSNKFRNLDINIGSKEHIYINVPNAKKDKNPTANLTAFFEKIEEYQNLNWEVVSINQLSEFSISGVMRRKK